jgi:hypothetical protein
MYFTSLPPDLLPYIFAYLSPSTLPLAVSREFHSAAISDRLWWEFFFRRWPRRKLRDGRVPNGRYSPDDVSWKQKFQSKLEEHFVVPPFYLSEPVPLSDVKVETEGPPSPAPSSESSDEDLSFLKRCYYQGYGRAMAEERKSVRHHSKR